LILIKYQYYKKNIDRKGNYDHTHDFDLGALHINEYSSLLGFYHGFLFLEEKSFAQDPLLKPPQGFTKDSSL
jgi:hypothetical protein